MSIWSYMARKIAVEERKAKNRGEHPDAGILTPCVFFNWLKGDYTIHNSELLFAAILRLK